MKIKQIIWGIKYKFDDEIEHYHYEWFDTEALGKRNAEELYFGGKKQQWSTYIGDSQVAIATRKKIILIPLSLFEEETE